MSLPFDLRPAAKSDFAFCWPIYRDAVRPQIEAPTEWHEADQRRVVELALADAGSSILRSEGADAGWLHVQETRQVIELKQFQLLPALRNRGLGTSFLDWMKERADRKRKDLYYARPAEYLDFCLQNFSRHVTLLHDYDLYEFTVLVRKVA